MGVFKLCGAPLAAHHKGVRLCCIIAFVAFGFGCVRCWVLPWVPFLPFRSFVRSVRGGGLGFPRVGLVPASGFVGGFRVRSAVGRRLGPAFRLRGFAFRLLPFRLCGFRALSGGSVPRWLPGVPGLCSPFGRSSLLPLAGQRARLSPRLLPHMVRI